jgi:hypothetical protein
MLTIEARNGRGRSSTWMDREGRPIRWRDRQELRRLLLRALAEGVSFARGVSQNGTEMMAYLEADGSACVSLGCERVSAARLAALREEAKS